MLRIYSDRDQERKEKAGSLFGRGASSGSGNNKKKNKPMPGTGTILEPIYEEPVAPSEMVRLQYVISFVQTQVFMRFQVRAAAKLLTRYSLLVVQFCSPAWAAKMLNPNILSISRSNIEAKIAASITHDKNNQVPFVNKNSQPGVCLHPPDLRGPREYEK